MKKQTIFPLIFIFLCLFFISVVIQGCGGGSYSNSGSSLQKGYVDIKVSYPQDKAHKAVSYYLIDIFDNENLTGSPVVPTTRVDYPETRARIKDVPVGLKWIMIVGFDAGNVAEYEGVRKINVVSGENPALEVTVTPISPTPSPTITPTPTPAPTVTPTPVPPPSSEYTYDTEWSDSMFVQIKDIVTDSVQIFATNKDLNPPYANEHIIYFNIIPNPVFNTFSSYGTGAAQINHPEGIALDNIILNAIFVADTYNNRIQMFSKTTGAFMGSFGAWDISGSGNGSFRHPKGVAIDTTNGYIYVLDTENGSSGYIQRFALSTVPSFDTQWVIPPDPITNTASCTGIALSSFGEIYVVDNANSRVIKFDDTGTVEASWGSPGPGDNQLMGPTKVVIDSNGDVLITNSQEGNIKKFTDGGVFLTKFGEPGMGPGQFNYPTGITIDNSGYVYVADQDNNRIQKFQHNPPPSP